MALANVTTYSEISPPVEGAAKYMLLERGQHLMTLERFGMVDPKAKNSTKTAFYRRYNSLARASAPLAEGVPPAGKKATSTDVSAVLEQYGDVVKLTDVIKNTHTDRVLQQYMKICGEQAAETIEEMRFNILKAGSSVFYADGVSARASVNSPPTKNDFRKIYRFLKNNKAREFTELIAATPKVSTHGVEGGYFAVGHTNLKADLRDVEGFFPVSEYSDSSKALPGEIGTIEEFRIILTSLFDPWTTSGASGTTYLSGNTKVSSAAQCDVYPMLFFARDSYGIMPLQGFGSIDINVKNPGKKAVMVGNELGQIGFVSWMTMQTCVILNQNWMARLECAASAL
jgi:N4-gp56 family major capsid protein